MNILQTIERLKMNFFSDSQKESVRKQRFILDITTTQAFSKMNTQDKITSLAKLIFSIPDGSRSFAKASRKETDQAE